MLKAPPLIPWTNISWHFKIGPKRGVNMFENSIAYVYSGDSFTNSLQTSVLKGVLQIPFAVVFKPGTPVLPTYISARLKFLNKMLLEGHMTKTTIFSSEFWTLCPGFQMKAQNPD